MISKSCEASLDYSICWPRRLLLGQTITGAVWRSEPEGLAVAPLDAGPGRSAVRVSGGAAGRCYRLVHRVTLSDDRTLTRTLDLRAVA